MVRRHWRPALAAAATVSAALAAAGCGAQSHPRAVAKQPPTTAEKITVNDAFCAPDWTARSAGAYSFKVVSQANRVASVSLVETGSGAVVAELPHAAPGSVGKLTAHLREGGDYQWSCQVRGVAPRTSSAWLMTKLGGGAPPAPPFPPTVVTQLQIAKPLREYRTYVDGLLAQLRPQLRSLGSEIAAGDGTAAKAAWLRAHMTYLRIGEDDDQYGAFGNLGERIDGGAGGFAAGPTSPKFTGFHRVEYDLFTRDDLAAAGRDTKVLQRLVAKLTPAAVKGYLPINKADMQAWALRPHEILEDGLRDTLGGYDNYGSGSQLASLTADVSATRKLLSWLAPLITQRAPHLVGRARADLRSLSHALASARTANGWKAPAALPTRERDAIEASVGSATETIAPVSQLMEVPSLPGHTS